MGAKYYLGLECNSEGMVCASYLSESDVLSSITLSLDLTSLNILKQLRYSKHKQTHINTLFRYLAV